LSSADSKDSKDYKDYKDSKDSLSLLLQKRMTIKKRQPKLLYNER